MRLSTAFTKIGQRLVWLLALCVLAGCAEKTPASPDDLQTVVDSDEDSSEPLDVGELVDVDGPTVDIASLDTVSDTMEDALPPDIEADTGDVDEPEEVLEDAQHVDASDALDVAEEIIQPDTLEDTGPMCPACAGSDLSATYKLLEESFETSLSRVRENPLRGFITSYLWGEPSNTLSDQMEFLYLPLSSVWDANGATLETGLEPYLVAAKERGHHAVVRVYIDYPKKPSGLPAYLMDAVGCTPYQEHGGGCSPNYDHPLMVEAMVGLLEAMGATYDGDPRLGVLQIGLIGFWGEWHTFPHTGWFPTNETQLAVLNAAHDAFSITQLQVRRPAANSPNLRIGFHDDSFAYSTLGDVDWFFYPQLVAAGADKRWEEVMIGGELRPELQSTVFDADYQLDVYAQDILECIETTHASYLLNYKGFSENGTGYTGSELESAEAAALKMGYRFELQAAELSLSNLQDGMVQAQVSVTLVQTGNAPFYYALFPALEVEGNVELVNSDDDLKTLLPGETRQVVFDLGVVDVATLGGVFKLHLLSEMLLPGQQVKLATTTPWTDDGEPTAFSWTIGCVADGQYVALGEVAGQDGSGCPCVCDVDGVIRHCGGAACF